MYTFELTPTLERPLEFSPGWTASGMIEPRVFDATDARSALAAMDAYLQRGDLTTIRWSVWGDPVMISTIDFAYQRILIYRSK
jgi:hypothetical protein